MTRPPLVLGDGTEVYVAVRLGRRGVGVGLKASYYRQAVYNIEAALLPQPEQSTLFGDAPDDADGLGDDGYEDAA